MKTITLTISDETLRDGEQQVGLCFAPETKQTLAHLIAQTGVQQIALMPAIHPTEVQLVKTLISEGLSDRIAASTMMARQFIDQSQACGVRQIILFHAVSDRLLFLRDPDISADLTYRGQTIDADIPPSIRQRIRTNMLHKVLEHLRYATKQGLSICFAAEDASRADFDFLVQCIQSFAPYLKQFFLCDTLGILTPEKTFVWIHDLLQSTQDTPLAVHFHNDMGLALENTIQAVLAGATGISGTFGGIGERSGNAALEQVLNGLRLRFGWEVAGIDYDALTQVTCYLEQRGIRANPPYSPAAQRHEAGIHVHSLLRDRQSYAIFPHSQPEIWFGKCSGASNFQYLFEFCLHQPLTRAQYEQLSVALKSIAIRENRSFSLEEVLQMLHRGILTI
jgi:isopropylmalate/homocitrate/citramalate synthase